MTLEERLIELLQASKKWVNANLRQTKLTQLLDKVIDGLENIVNPAVRDAAEKKESIDTAKHNTSPPPAPSILSPVSQKQTEVIIKQRIQQAEINRITPFRYVQVPPTRAKDLLPPEPNPTPAQVNISRGASLLDQAAVGVASPANPAQSNAQPFLANPANDKQAIPKAPAIDPQNGAADSPESTYKSPTPFDGMRRGPRPRGAP